MGYGDLEGVWMGCWMDRLLWARRRLSIARYCR